jgi:hypothetical protein
MAEQFNFSAQPKVVRSKQKPAAAPSVAPPESKKKEE